MTSLIFRRAEAGDLQGIISLLADDALGVSREDVGPIVNPRYVEAFEAINHDPNQLLACADDNGEIVGCLQISFIPGLSRLGMTRGQIESVRIASHRRGNGIGRAMLDWAIGQCSRRGCTIVQLTTDKSRPDALRFYEALGFKASHEGLKLLVN